MRHTVVVEVGRGGEAFATHWTLVWLFSAVNPSMRVKRTRRREALTANVANMRFLPCGQPSI